MPQKKSSVPKSKIICLRQSAEICPWTFVVYPDFSRSAKCDNISDPPYSLSPRSTSCSRTADNCACIENKYNHLPEINNCSVTYRERLKRKIGQVTKFSFSKSQNSWSIFRKKNIRMR